MKEKSCKIYLDLSQGAIEIEGTEEFVTEQFEHLKKILLDSKGLKDIKPAHKGKTRTKPSRRAAIKNEIDLKASAGNPSLLEFYDKARRPTFLSRSLLFLYYLKNVKKHQKINTAHIKVCYGAVKANPPSNIYQNVIVGGGKKEWVDVSSTKDLKLTPTGIEEVEKVLLSPERRVIKKKKTPVRKKKTKGRKKKTTALKKKTAPSKKKTAPSKKAPKKARKKAPKKK